MPPQKRLLRDFSLAEALPASDYHSGEDSKSRRKNFSTKRGNVFHTVSLQSAGINSSRLRHAHIADKWVSASLTKPLQTCESWVEIVGSKTGAENSSAAAEFSAFTFDNP